MILGLHAIDRFDHSQFWVGHYSCKAAGIDGIMGCVYIEATLNLVEAAKKGKEQVVGFKDFCSNSHAPALKRDVKGNEKSFSCLRNQPIRNWNKGSRS